MNTVRHVKLAFVVCFCCCATPVFSQNRIPVVIDHMAGTMSPSGLISLKDGDILAIKVINTSKMCFEFNQTSLPTTPLAQGASIPATDEVEWEIIHDESAAKYQIEARKKTEVKDCPSALKDKTWIITVESYGWQLGMAGAFTLEKLTDPVFRLVETSEGGQEGFRAVRNTAAEDAFKPSVAAMIHLFHSDSKSLTIGRDIGWVPLSFGLGIENDSKAKYYLGTGFRFSRRLFATAGAVFGSVPRLPNDLAENEFTTDGSVLSNNSASRSVSSFFFSLSFNLADVDLSSAFKDKLTAAPAPKNP